VKRSRQPEDLLPLTPLSIAILLAVADGPRHGYAIVKELERETEGRVVPGAGTLYAALQRMVDEGVIEETEGSDPNDDQRRRYYALTAFGRDVTRAELRRLERLIELAGAKRLVPALRVSARGGRA
jgi:DNA-binding PadR family transcriptional regulator